MMERLLFFVAAVALLLMPAGALAQEEIQPGEVTAQEVIEGEDLPTYDTTEQEETAELAPMHYGLTPEFAASLGFNYVEIEGSNRAMEYRWPHSSAVGGLGLHYYPLPHRIDLDLDWLNHYDYSSEMAYAYKDIVKLDFMGLALWHNLDHFRPQNGAATPAEDRNPAAVYGVSVRDNRVKLRLKWPDMAYHAFTEFREYTREGAVQQRFTARNLADTASTKISRTREIDWTTRSYRIGANGHFGPIEAEYSHRIKDFRPHGDVEMVDPFRFGGVTSPAVHNVVPEINEHSNTVKLHTDLTGRAVASAVFVSGERRNERSGAEVDFRRAGGDFVLIPLPGVTFSMRYSFKDIQADSPETLNDSLVGVVRPLDPMDKKTNRAEAVLKYSPFRRLTLKAEYIYENIHREGAKAWSREELPGQLILPYRWLPDDQNIHKVRLGFNSRPFKDMSFKGLAEYIYNDDIAYPTEVTRAVKGKFDAGYDISSQTNVSAHYSFFRGNSGSASRTIGDVISGISYFQTVPDLDIERDNAGVLLLYNPVERFSMSAGYEWMRFRNESYIEFLRPAPRTTPVLADRIAYRDSSHAYHVGAAYAFAFPLSVETEFRQSYSRGKYPTSDLTRTVGLTVHSISGVGELTDMRIRETGGSLTARYAFPKGWGTSVSYSVNNYDDLEDKPQDGLQDGMAHMVMLLVSKKW